jgi:hypothetical protein
MRTFGTMRDPKAEHDAFMNMLAATMPTPPARHGLFGRVAVAAMVGVGMALLALAGASPGAAQAKPPVTVAQGLSLLGALRNLDGRVVVIKGANGADQTVMLPWEFASGTLRIKIAKNIATLAANEKAANDAREAIIKELLGRMPAGKDGAKPTTILPGTPEFDRFTVMYGEALEQPAKGSDELLRFKPSELKLEKNEIPVTALAAMAPILDLD